jgi:hypothetical protein
MSDSKTSETCPTYPAHCCGNCGNDKCEDARQYDEARMDCDGWAATHPICDHDTVDYVEENTHRYYRTAQFDADGNPFCDTNTDADRDEDDGEVASAYFICLDCGERWAAAALDANFIARHIDGPVTKGR